MNQPKKPGGLTESLNGAIDVMLGRESGLARIDVTAGGFSASFAGLLIAGLIDMSALSMLYNKLHSADPVPVSKAYYVFGKLVIALIAYLASMMALYVFCRRPEEQARVTTTIILHNWASPIVSLAFFPFLILSTMSGGLNTVENPNLLFTLISVFWIGVLVFIGFRLIRIGLNVDGWRAAGLFFATAAVSLICTEGLEILVGLRFSS